MCRSAFCLSLFPQQVQSSSSGKSPISFSCLCAKDLLCLRIFFFLFVKGKEPFINNHTVFSRKRVNTELASCAPTNLTVVI